MRRDDAVAAIRSRIQRITSGPDGVLAPAGEIEAEQLADLVFANRDDIDLKSLALELAEGELGRGVRP